MRFPWDSCWMVMGFELDLKRIQWITHVGNPCWRLPNAINYPPKGLYAFFFGSGDESWQFGKWLGSGMAAPRVYHFAPIP